MKERIWYLDFVRGIAVILVVIHHINGCLIDENVMIGNNNYIITLGWKNGNFGVLGVSLFFIISGAALMVTYREDFSIKQYALKRYKSIYPLFYIAYLLTFLFFFWDNKGLGFIHAPKQSIVLTILGLDGYLTYLFPTWYLIGEWFLGCIVILYIMFPLLKMLIEKYGWIKVFIVYFILYSLCVVFYPFKMSITRNFLIRGFDMLFGMLFITKIKKIPISFGIFDLLLMFILIFFKIPKYDMFGFTLMGWSAFVACVFISQFLKFDFVKRFFGILSKYSYGCFLTHHIIIHYIMKCFVGRRLSRLEGFTLILLIFFMIAIITKVLFLFYESIKRAFGMKNRRIANAGKKN